MKWTSKLGIGVIVLGALACNEPSQDVNVEYKCHPPLIQEVNGDGLPDIVFGVRVCSWDSHNGKEYESYNVVYDIYFRKNEGDGQFAAPKLLLRTDPNMGELGVPILYLRSENSGKDIWGKPDGKKQGYTL